MSCEPRHCTPAAAAAAAVASCKWQLTSDRRLVRTRDKEREGGTWFANRDSFKHMCMLMEANYRDRRSTAKTGYRLLAFQVAPNLIHFTYFNDSLLPEFYS